MYPIKTSEIYFLCECGIGFRHFFTREQDKSMRQNNKCPICSKLSIEELVIEYDETKKSYTSRCRKFNKRRYES